MSAASQLAHTLSIVWPSEAWPDVGQESDCAHPNSDKTTPPTARRLVQRVLVGLHLEAIDGHNRDISTVDASGRDGAAMKDRLFADRNSRQGHRLPAPWHPQIDNCPTRTLAGVVHDLADGRRHHLVAVGACCRSGFAVTGLAVRIGAGPAANALQSSSAPSSRQPIRARRTTVRQKWGRLTTAGDGCAALTIWVMQRIRG